MSNFIAIQPRIFCEPCKECGARPVIKQLKGNYTVMCPKDKTHYSTKPGLIDVNDWNAKNKKQPPFVNDADVQKAS